MAVGKLKARSVGDLDEARTRNKGGGDSYTLIVKPDSELTVRFLDEPDEWTEFYQHYMPEMEPRAFACNDGDCVGCAEGNRPSKKWAARVLDVNESRIRVFVMTKQVWEKLLGRRAFLKFNTILDRNYIIIRTGSGLTDTDYDVDPDSASRMNLKKYATEIDALDVEEFLMSGVPTARPESSGKKKRRRDEDDEPPRRGSKKSSSRRSSRDEDDDDDEDDDAPWDEEERPARRRSASRGGSARKPGKPAARKPAAPAKKTRRRI